MTEDTKRAADSLIRKLSKIAVTMEENGIVMMSGHSMDTATLIDEETGNVLGRPTGRVWMGGDPVYEHRSDGTYCCKDICE